MNDFARVYLCSFKSEIKYLTLEEIEEQFNLRVNRSQIGMDRGTMFNTIAIKIDNWTGNYKIVSYLPNGCKPNKKHDVLIQINFKEGN